MNQSHMQDASQFYYYLEEKVKKKELNETKLQEETFHHLFDAHYPEMNRFCSNENEIVGNQAS